IKCLLRVGSSMMLGIALAAIYLLPAMLEQNSVAMGEMRVGDGYYEEGFFLSHARWNLSNVARNSFERDLFWMLAIGVGVAAIAWIVARNRVEVSTRRQRSFWIAML